MPARRGLLAALTVALALIPNNPHRGWYAIPEVVCGWFHSDEDQWQCDEEPIDGDRAVAEQTVTLKLTKPEALALLSRPQRQALP